MIKKNNIKNGLLIFNKPKSITSNNTLKKIKNILKNKKIGYIGSLDPISSGILLIAFGKTNKLFNKIIKKKKTYKITIKLGEKTNTYDAYGYITKKYFINDKKKIIKKNINKIIKKYKGKILHNIPTYSSCKYKGKPLYKYAIKGINIKKKKYIYIYKIKINKIKKKIVKLTIVCSKGTYIRSIINDIGKKLKYGAYILNLKRIKIGKFKIKKSYNFNDIKKKKNNNIIIPHKKIIKLLYNNNLKNI